ncbi:MAG: cobalamin biosynthesis protein [Desulfovibrio sp.]|nr:cobalamin biosynthesis protein [Desulfovibrio sp.]
MTTDAAPKTFASPPGHCRALSVGCGRPERPPWTGCPAFARCDDALAYIPARFSVVVLWLTDKIAGKHLRDGVWPGFADIARQARGMTSPNSGWSMVACA